MSNTTAPVTTTVVVPTRSCSECRQVCTPRRAVCRTRSATRPNNPENGGRVTACSWRAGFVPDAAHRQHHLGPFRVALDLGPKSLHVDVNEPGVGRVPVAPDLLEQHLAGEHLPRLAGQRDEQVELQRG